MLRLFMARVCYVIAGGCLLCRLADAQVVDHYWFHDPPYVDPFFNPNGTAKTTYANGYTTRPRHPGHAGRVHDGALGHGVCCTHCGHGLSQGHCPSCGIHGGSASGEYCSQCGSQYGDNGAACTCSLSGMNGDRVMGRRGPICPDVTTARLQVYVPDCYQVEINGQRTEPQTLAGIHRNSRIFTLAGLSFDAASPTDIVVFERNSDGTVTTRTCFVDAQAGQSYIVRYPGHFGPATFVPPTPIATAEASNGVTKTREVQPSVPETIVTPMPEPEEPMRRESDVN